MRRVHTDTSGSVAILPKLWNVKLAIMRMTVILEILFSNAVGKTSLGTVAEAGHQRQAHSTPLFVRFKPLEVEQTGSMIGTSDT